MSKAGVCPHWVATLGFPGSPVSFVRLWPDRIPIPCFPAPHGCVTLGAMKHFFTCVVLASAALSASAQTLWRDAPMQASPTDIRALMPDARETLPGQRARDPSALLEIPSTPIANEDFAATFHFESERLQRIRLHTQPATRERTQALLQALQASLRARYGLPISTKTRPGAALGSVDLKWSFRRMTVQLQMMDGKTVELIYDANIPSPSVAL